MGGVNIVFGIDDKGYSAGVERIRRQSRQLKADLDRIGDVSPMQASSAALRTLEGGMQSNLRAAERFISLIPGLSAGLQKAFPVVGAIAFAGVVARVGEEATKAIQKVLQAPQAISNSFRELNLGAETSIDTLRLSTAKMNEQIALLTGKRPNELAIELAEASLAADKLASSLDNDQRKLSELMKTNGLSGFSGLLGRAGTAEVGGSVNSFDQQMADLAARRQHATRTGDTAGAADLLKQLDDKRNAAMAYANSQIAQRQRQGVGGLNQDANLAILTGFRNTLVDQGDQEQSETANASSAVQLKKIEDARKFAEMQKQAQTQLLKVYEDQERAQNAFNKLSVNEEIQFWSDRITAFTKGGEQYLQVQNRIYDEIAKRPDLTSENKKNQAAAGKATVEGNDLLGNAQRALRSINTEQMERALQITRQYNEAMEKGSEEQMKAAAGFRETSIAIGIEQGTMSRLQAAQALAASHEKEHAQALTLVNVQLERQISLIRQTPDSKMSPDEKSSAIDLANKQAEYERGGINDNYKVTQARDVANAQSSTISGAQREALNQMVQSFQDLAANLKQIIPQTFESLNGDIVKAMTGHGKAADFGKTFSDAGQSLMKASLQKIEGGFLSAAGLGKPDGSQNNPIWTKDANGVASVGGKVTGNALFRPFFGGQQGDQQDGYQQGGKSGGGSIWGNLLHSFVPTLLKRGGQGSQDDSGGGGDDDSSNAFQGFFAGGGDVLANRPSIVGERGPEMFIPQSAGRIVPNRQLGGGDVHHHWNIDARGSNDPAAIHSAVKRGVDQAMAGSVHLQHQRHMRTPHGR